MTEAEIESMSSFKLIPGERLRIQKILKEQYSPTGLVRNVSTIAAGATILEVVNDLGLNGKVTYKTVDNKTYVILKGLAKERTILTGTRYLNTHPDIVRLGLAKVSVTDLFKTGFKTSILVYGGVKAIEGVKIYLENGELDSSFFSNLGTDVPKLAINSLAASLTAGGLALLGCPVAVGAGIVIVAGFGAGISLDLLDQQIGLTEKLSEAVEIMWRNLKKNWSTSFQNHDKISMKLNLLEGLVFRSPSNRPPQYIRKGEHFVYTI